MNENWTNRDLDESGPPSVLEIVIGVGIAVIVMAGIAYLLGFIGK